MSAAEKANLARIRDNQRRSRARRKEYLQELEARLRQCELQGIEASAEIQLAARRVADENKKLRILLGQNGVGDNMVEAFLRSTVSLKTTASASYGGMGGMPNSGAVQALEHLLNTRKQCRSDGNTGAPGPRATSAGGQSGESSTAGSISTVQSLWDSSFNSHLSPQKDLTHTSGSGKTPQRQYMSPPTTVSRKGSVVSSGKGGNLGGQQQQYQQQSQRQRNRQTPTTPSMNTSSSTARASSQQAQTLYEYEPHSMHPSYHCHQLHHPQSHPHLHTSNINSPTQLARSHNLPHELGPISQSSQYRPTTSTGGGIAGTYSCISATEMISNMAGGDPIEVRTDLGCLPNGMECQVDNQLVFNVMDRYSGQGNGL